MNRLVLWVVLLIYCMAANYAIDRFVPKLNGVIFQFRWKDLLIPLVGVAIYWACVATHLIPAIL